MCLEIEGPVNIVSRKHCFVNVRFRKCVSFFGRQTGKHFLRQRIISEKQFSQIFLYVRKQGNSKGNNASFFGVGGGELQRSPTPILCVDAPPPGSFYRKLFRFLFYRLLFHCNKLARDAGGGIWGKGALTNNCSIEISWC